MQNQKKINCKYLFPLIQLVVLALLCVSIFDKECIVLVKNVIESFHLNEGLRVSLYRVLISAKVLFDAPSLFAFLFVVLQFFCFTATILFVISLFYNSFKIEERRVVDCDYIKCSKKFSKTDAYLKTVRLLC
ncbi:MAG: hypothetical protein E7345_03615 [Clostridiales bacterium]|nr:hypothetical protein [Clostridiales bacterium]